MNSKQTLGIHYCRRSLGPFSLPIKFYRVVTVELHSGRCTTDTGETRDVTQVPAQCIPRIEGSLTVTIPAEVKINNNDTAYRKQWLEKRQVSQYTINMFGFI